jgi:hypothetical protein
LTGNSGVMPLLQLFILHWGVSCVWYGLFSTMVSYSG